LVSTIQVKARIGMINLSLNFMAKITNSNNRPALENVNNRMRLNKPIIIVLPIVRFFSYSKKIINGKHIIAKEFDTNPKIDSRFIKPNPGTTI